MGGRKMYGWMEDIALGGWFMRLGDQKELPGGLKPHEAEYERLYLPPVDERIRVSRRHTYTRGVWHNTGRRKRGTAEC